MKNVTKFFPDILFYYYICRRKQKESVRYLAESKFNLIIISHLGMKP